MNFLGNQKIETERKFNLCDLTFILEPPQCSVTLQEFEDYAVARLKLLRIFERLSLTAASINEAEMKAKVRSELEQAGLVEFVNLFSTSDKDDMERSMKFDHISHHILRLAFCRSEDLRRWFVTMEVEYFKFKFTSSVDGNLAKEVLDTHFKGTIKKYEFPMSKDGENIDVETKESSDVEISDNEGSDEERKAKFLRDLKDVYFSTSSIVNADLYEVPFTACLELVKSRNVYLRGGKAIVFHPQLLTIVCSEFRRLLSKQLALTSKTIHLVDEDPRLEKILRDFDKRHTGSSFTAKAGSSTMVTVEQLDDLAQTSFPLCMKSLHETVKKEYHLKHFGRLQLGLFFKGLGLPMEEATRFWRDNFTKKTGVDQGRFDKQYLYNIRHMYGKEGKKADYTPYSCMKIIMSSVGPGETHGCPFKHEDSNSLRTKLVAAGVPPTGIKEITELLAKQHYQIACQRYFEWTHSKVPIEGGVNHPNQYFEESRKVLSGNFKIKTETINPPVKATRASVYIRTTAVKPEDYSLIMDHDDDEIFKDLNDSVTSVPESD